MFRETPDTQVSFGDRYIFANDQTKKAVDSSRAKLIGDVIYPNVDEQKFAPLFSTVCSRPNESIRRYVCALVLKRSYGISDEIMFEMLRCGAVNFQYALHTTQEDRQPLSESSLRRFRRRIEAYNEEHNCDLIKDEFTRISRQMAVNMGLLGKDPDETGEAGSVIVRMDSMEIEAHAKAMGRLEILYTTVVIILRYLLKKGFENIIPQSFSHYYEKGDKNHLIYHRAKKDKEAGKPDTRLEETLGEMLLLREIMERNFGQEILTVLPEYQTFLRVLSEQTVTKEDGTLILKPSSDISPDSVQNPFDTTVTYRFKKKANHGFVMNVAEAIDDHGNGIIIDADVEQNTVADNILGEAYIARQPDNGPRQTISLDGAYSGDDIEELAKSKNIDLVPTALSGAEPYDIDAEFTLNDEGTEVLSCPAGIVPVSNRYNAKSGMIIATMPGNCCATCPHCGSCNVFFGKKVPKVHISAKMINRANMARSIASEEGKANARRRNGVEGIMSVMRRKYGLDHLPVFGLDRYRPWVWATLLAYNIAKYQKYLKSQNRILAM